MPTSAKTLLSEKIAASIVDDFLNYFNFEKKTRFILIKSNIVKCFSDYLNNVYITQTTTQIAQLLILKFSDKLNEKQININCVSLDSFSQADILVLLKESIQFVFSREGRLLPKINSNNFAKYAPAILSAEKHPILADIRNKLIARLEIKKADLLTETWRYNASPQKSAIITQLIEDLSDHNQDFIGTIDAYIRKNDFSQDHFLNKNRSKIRFLKEGLTDTAKILLTAKERYKKAYERIHHKNSCPVV